LQGEDNAIILPQNSDFHFTFATQNKASAKNIQAILRTKNVLADSSTSQHTLGYVNLVEAEKGVYSGDLKTSNPGNYELYIKIADNNGNVTEQKLTDVKVINKFTVISSKDKSPIEGARVYIYRFDPTIKTYQLIPYSLISGGNPIFTDSAGQLNLILPQGKYKAEVTDLRHKDKTVEFEIGFNKGQEFPIVELDNSKISFFSLIEYYRRTINDVFIYNTKIYSQALTGSTRFFDLISMLSLLGIIVITLFAFSKRHRIPLSSIPSYFYYLVDRKDRSDKYIHGVVYDENDQPIPLANIYLTDKENEKIVASTKTNKEGEFYFKKGNTQYLIMAMAKNYITSPIFEYKDRSHLKLKITLSKEEAGLNLLGKLNHYFTHILGLTFEVLLLGSFIFELLFINSFGVAKTLPFLGLTIFNLALWALHLRNKAHSKTVI
jgi:hypothetical protein